MRKLDCGIVHATGKDPLALPHTACQDHRAMADCLEASALEMPPTDRARSEASPIARLIFGAEDMRDKFDRHPFGFTHNLDKLDLFHFQSLCQLAERYVEHREDYFVSSGAPSPAADFYATDHGRYSPIEALDRLDGDSQRILLKRPELHDPRFRELLHLLLGQVLELRGGLRGQSLRRLESGIFISSAATVTPFHFDPEVAFFSQIEGEKIYHIYPPESLSEQELERFYVCDMINIGQAQLNERDPSAEQVFRLGPGTGVHQPQDAPHWVETRGTRSVSYSFVFETSASKARGRTLAFNHYLRKLGANPAPFGQAPGLDAVKAGVMRALLPLRAGVRGELHAPGKQ